MPDILRSGRSTRILSLHAKVGKITQLLEKLLEKVSGLRVEGEHYLPANYDLLHDSVSSRDALEVDEACSSVVSPHMSGATKEQLDQTKIELGSTVPHGEDT